MAHNTYSNQNIEVEAFFCDTNNVCICSRAHLRDSSYRTNFYEDENESEHFGPFQYDADEDNEFIQNPYENALNESSENPLVHENLYEEDYELMESLGLPTSFGKKHRRSYKERSYEFNDDIDYCSEENVNESDDSNYDTACDEENSYSPDEIDDKQTYETKTDKEHSKFQNKIDGDFADYWALHGGTIILNSWVLKYKDYISEEYLQKCENQLKIPVSSEMDSGAQKERPNHKNDLQMPVDLRNDIQEITDNQVNIDQEITDNQVNIDQEITVNEDNIDQEIAANEDNIDREITVNEVNIDEEINSSQSNDLIITDEHENDLEMVNVENENQKTINEQESDGLKPTSAVEGDNLEQLHLTASAINHQTNLTNIAHEITVETTMQLEHIDDIPVDTNKACLEPKPESKNGDNLSRQVLCSDGEENVVENGLSEECGSDFGDVDPVLLPIEDISLNDPELDEINDEDPPIHQRKIPNLFTCTVENSEVEKENGDETEYDWDDLWTAHCLEEYDYHYKLFSESYFKKEEIKPREGESTFLDALRCNFCGEYNCDLCITDDYKNSHSVSNTYADLYSTFNSSRKEGGEYIWSNSAPLILKDISLTLNDLSIPENIFSADGDDTEELSDTGKTLQNDSDSNELPLEMPIKMKRQ